MYNFIAMRIHDGFLTWAYVQENKDKKFATAVRKAYKKLYGVYPA